LTAKSSAVGDLFARSGNAVKSVNGLMDAAPRANEAASIHSRLGWLGLPVPLIKTARAEWREAAVLNARNAARQAMAL